MSDQAPHETQNPDDLIDELHALGDNLRQMLASAWGSPERLRLQQDLEQGLADITSNLNKAAADFQASPAGQSLKEDIADFNERLRTGEVESAVRREVLNALRLANDGLKKAAEHINKTPPTP